jgi:hypothetical protein
MKVIAARSRELKSEESIRRYSVPKTSHSSRRFQRALSSVGATIKFNEVRKGLSPSPIGLLLPPWVQHTSTVPYHRHTLSPIPGAIHSTKIVHFFKPYDSSKHYVTCSGKSIEIMENLQDALWQLHSVLGHHMARKRRSDI